MSPRWQALRNRDQWPLINEAHPFFATPPFCETLTFGRFAVRCQVLWIRDERAFAEQGEASRSLPSVRL